MICWVKFGFWVVKKSEKFGTKHDAPHKCSPIDQYRRKHDAPHGLFEANVLFRHLGRFTWKERSLVQESNMIMLLAAADVGIWNGCFFEDAEL